MLVPQSEFDLSLSRSRGVLTDSEFRSDVIVKIVNAEDTNKVQILAGHKQPVREASWSPDGNLLVSRRCG